MRDGERENENKRKSNTGGAIKRKKERRKK